MRIAAKSVQKMRLDGVAVKVNGTAMIKHKGKYSIWAREYS
jgi:hypothetical protein